MYDHLGLSSLASSLATVEVEKHLGAAAVAVATREVAGARAARERKERREVLDAILGCCDGNGLGRGRAIGNSTGPTDEAESKF